MRVIMLKPTRYKNRWFSRGIGYPVDDATGKRWIRKRIAFIAPPDDGAPEETEPSTMEDIEEIEAEKPDENNGEPSVKELKVIAKSEGIKGYSKMSKTELMEILNGNNDAN